MSPVHGIHHVTCISGDAQENFDFYTEVLGLRLVKRSVNQDVPDTYHLFYADAEGNPGTDLTFFPWPQMPPGRKGAGLTVEVGLAVPREASPSGRNGSRRAAWIRTLPRSVSASGCCACGTRTASSCP